MHEITLRQPSAGRKYIFFGESEERNIFPQIESYCEQHLPLKMCYDWLTSAMPCVVCVRVRQKIGERDFRYVSASSVSEKA